MSTAEQPDALAHRIEQLAAAAGDRGEDVAAAVAALEDTRGSLEARLAVLEDALDAVGERLEALARDGAGTTTAMLQALGETVRSLDRRLAAAGDGARSPVDGGPGLDDARARALEDAVVSRLSSALAARDDELRRTVLEAVREGQQRAEQDRAAARDLREQVLDRLAELTSGVTRSATAAETAGARIERLVDVEDELSRTVAQLRDGVSATTAELAAELRAYAREQAELTASRVQGLDEQVRAALTELRDGVDERAAQLSAVLARGLTEIADEIDVAATTTRDASERVTVLTEVTEVQRAELARLLHGVHDDVVDTSRTLRDALLAGTGEQLTALGAQLDRLQAAVGASAAGVDERLGAVDEGVAHAAGSVERALSGLDELVAAHDRLGGTVEGFRSEWPTRTYEVVQGARAVAEAVVLDVRGEVGAHLQDVRAALDRVAGRVDDARSGLDDGTDRLAQAGHVLVAYLEQRDRLLEAERDRVLHDVLEAFAAGLSARERSALAGRVNDAVARRRDARDAERYREAVGEPVPPAVDLPDDVRRLAAGGQAAEGADGAVPPGSGGSYDPGPGGPASGAPGTGGAGADGTVAGGRGSQEAGAGDAGPGGHGAGPVSGGSTGASVVRAAEQDAPRTSVPRPDLARGGRGGGAVVPGPGRASGQAAARQVSAPDARARPAAAGGAERGRGAVVRAAPGAGAPSAGARRSGAAGRPASSARPVAGRGRLAAMPEAPSVDVALDAAAPAGASGGASAPRHDAAPGSSSTGDRPATPAADAPLDRDRSQPDDTAPGSSP